MKIFKSLLIIFLLVFLITGCNSTKVNQIQNGVEIHSGNLNVKAQFYADNIVRITKWSNEGTSEKKSLSVIEQSVPTLNITTEETKTDVTLKSGMITLKVNKKTGNVEYLTSSGENILKETGETMLTPVVFSGDKGFAMQQNFTLAPDEGIYGLGQHQDGLFNYRGKEVVLVQSNTEAVNPFLVSTKNWGILWDNYSKTIFKDGAQGTSVWSDMGDNIDYYFVKGDNIDKVVSGYRYLTGKAPMYGKYAYGYWQSKEHYDTQEELLTVARKYRKLKIPIDNMIQDWDYWNGNKNWGSMEFDKTLFPEPQKMMDELHGMNFHAIISIWPAIGPNTAFYKEMDKHPGFLYPTIGWAGFKYIDAYNPAAMEMYCKYMNEGIYSKGLDGWWMDSTEPDVVCALTKESTNYELKKQGSNHLGSFARYLGGTASWRTDLYSGPTSGTLMTHRESIELFKRLGVKMTPELKSPSVTMPFDGFTQQAYAQKMIDEYKKAGVAPSKVWPQSFNKDDVLYWIQSEPAFGRQAVYLDDANTVADLPTAAELLQYKKQGINIWAPPTFALLDANGSEIVPSVAAMDAKAAGLDIITWTLERSGILADGGNGFYYQTFDSAIRREGDMMRVLDVLARQVGILGIFSDWPATVTYYANCTGLK